MPTLSELTPTPHNYAERLPYKVWGNEAVHAADNAVAAQLNEETLNQYRSYLESETPADEAGWQAHLTPLMELGGSGLSPEEVKASAGSYALVGAEMAQELDEEYNLVQEGLNKSSEIGQHLNELRTALKDISKDDDPDPKVREEGDITAISIGDEINKYAPCLLYTSPSPRD